MEGSTNGKGTITALGRGEIPRPPDRVDELARACVEFVRRATQVTLDYTLETLPVLDHYMSSARAAAHDRPEALPLLAHSIGAYFGEVVRRRHASWWKTEGDDPAYWKIELENVYLAFYPVQLAADALRAHEQHDADDASFELLDEDRDAVAGRLLDLPEVSVEEYYSLSTRLEVIDIAIEAIRARRMQADEDADQPLTPDDYE